MMTTIDDVKAAHRGYFFSTGAMRFFDSRVLSRVFPLADGGALFVTSERYASEPRRYTVRRIDSQGDIDTVGEFQEFATVAAAYRRAAAMVSE